MFVRSNYYTLECLVVDGRAAYDGLCVGDVVCDCILVDRNALYGHDLVGRDVGDGVFSSGEYDDLIVDLYDRRGHRVALVQCEGEGV